MVFYGDDTWTRLFPGSFLRQDATTSFYVNDYTEVDSNVSRHLDQELEVQDWDVMILHYLGLDHIGHIAGPASPLVPPKLAEMSEALEKIWRGLLRNREGEDNLPPAMVVVGDHGMADGGGHGGASLPEVLVPFVLIGGGLMDEDVDSEEVLQIDTASCLAFLTGVAIPAGSLGKLPPSFLASFNLTDAEELAALEYQASILTPSSPSSKGLDQVEEGRKLMQEDSGRAKDMFRTAIHNLQLDATSSLATYDLPLLVLTTLSLALLTMMAVSDHPLFHLPSLLLALPLTLFIHFGVNCVSPSSAVCSLNVQQLAITPLLLSLVSFCVRLDRSVFVKIKTPFLGSFSPTSLFLPVSCLVHGLSLQSSSFVEEEHQTVYFLYSSFLLLLLLEQRRAKVDEVKALQVLACLTMHRLASSFHSTGDKWRHLPDLAQWLKETPHGCALATLLSCIVLLLLLKEENKLPLAIKTVVVGIILAHKLANPCPVELVRLAYLLVLILPFTSSPSLPILTRLAHSVTLLTFLLHSPTHLPVLALLLLQLHLLPPTLSALHPSVQPLVFILLARVSFFQLGGSNSLATIDVGAGYTGLTEFNPVLVTLLMAVHTYSGSLITLLSAPITFTSALLQALPVTLGLELTMFCLVATLLRHHLFVWTVFSPKLLYLGMQLVVFTCIATVIQIVKYIQT